MQNLIDRLSYLRSSLSDLKRQIEKAEREIVGTRTDLSRVQSQIHDRISNGLESYAKEHHESIVDLRDDGYSLLYLKDRTALLLRSSYVCHSTHRNPYDQTDRTKKLFIGVGCRHCLTSDALKNIASAISYSPLTTIFSVNSDRPPTTPEEVSREFLNGEKLNSIIWKDWMSQPVPRLASIHPDLWTYDIRQRLEE